MSQLKEKEDKIAGFDNYEDYVKHHITPIDLFYIEDEELIFEIFMWGVKSRGILSQEEFNSIFQNFQKKRKNEKASIEEKTKEDQQKHIYNITEIYKETDDFFRMVFSHIHYCKEKRIGSILFIRYINKNDSEISSYIDINCNNIFSQILKRQYIYGSKKDLSFFNWKTNYVSTNDSENYEIITNKKIGLIFLHKESNTYFVLHSIKQLITSVDTNDSKTTSADSGSALGVRDNRDKSKNSKNKNGNEMDKEDTHSKKIYTFSFDDNIYKIDLDHIHTHTHTHTDTHNHTYSSNNNHNNNHNNNNNYNNYNQNESKKLKNSKYNKKVATLCPDVKKVVIHDPNYLQCLLYTFPIR